MLLLTAASSACACEARTVRDICLVVKPYSPPVGQTVDTDQKTKEKNVSTSATKVIVTAKCRGPNILLPLLQAIIVFTP